MRTSLWRVALDYMIGYLIGCLWVAATLWLFLAFLKLGAFLFPSSLLHAATLATIATGGPSLGLLGALIEWLKRR